MVLVVDDEPAERLLVIDEDDCVRGLGGLVGAAVLLLDEAVVTMPACPADDPDAASVEEVLELFVGTRFG